MPEIRHKMVELSDAAVRRHNACLRVLGPLLGTMAEGLDQCDHHDAALKWVMIESLCLMVGRMHGLPNRAIAEQIERIAERVLTRGDDLND